MWQFVLGFGTGVYVASKYDCNPTVKFIADCIKKNIPKEALPKKKDDKK